jgi:ketosteroid isomerase-like protein
MAQNQPGTTDLIDRFFRQLEAGAIDDCLELFADDAVVWHNYDDVEQTPAEAMAPLRGLGGLGATFCVLRRYSVPDGCIQQHVVQRRTPGGETVELHAIQRICVEDGKIARIDEYMDTAQAGRFATSQ